MILFLEDWDLEENASAIVHTQTTNQSFLDLSVLLRTMGIKNHTFFLALHNPALVGVDPYDPNLTQEQIVSIVEECKLNPWYFFREIARGPAASGSEPIRFRINRANLALIWLFFNHITTLLIQARQTGKSFSTDMLMTCLKSVVVMNTKFNLLTKDDALRVANVTRLKDIYNELPYYLQLKDRSDTNNTEKITVNALGNVYTTSVAQPSIKGALKLGRGMTIAINHIDEIAFIKNISHTLPALLASGGAARDSAKAAGEPYGNIFTTTAGYLNSEEGKYVHDEIYTQAMPWTEKLYDCLNEAELVATVKKNSPGNKVMVLLEFNHRQLGYTDDWLREKIADAMATGDAVKADFLNIWVEGSATSPIPKHLLKLMSDSVRGEPYVDISNYGYVTRWYVSESTILNEMRNRHIIISLDTSDAVGRDDIAMIIRDVKTGGVLGAGQYNETNLITFSEWLSELFDQFENMVMIIERRSSGVAIIDNLLKLLPAKGLDPFAKIFNWVVDEADAYPDRFNTLKIGRQLESRDPSTYIKYRKHFGYATGGSGKASRDNLYGDSLLSAIKYTGNRTHDKQLVEQVSGLTVKNGRIDHRTGSKDDLVISWMLGYWFLTTARNKKYYGIPNNIVLSVVVTNELSKGNTKEKLEMQQYQLSLKGRIDMLLEELRKENNEMKSLMITNKIKLLYKDVNREYVPSFDIEDVLENIRIEKRKHRRY
jgi:hypothetical protein